MFYRKTKLALARKEEQLASRMKLARGYEAAKQDRLVDGWGGDYGVASFDISSQLPVIRNRCRELAKNDPYVSKYIVQLRNNVIGHAGIKLSCNVTDWVNGKRIPDVMASDILERGWQLWGETPEFCDTEGKKTLTEILWRAVECWAREGEALIEMVPGFDYPQNPFAFSLKIRRPDSLAVGLITVMQNGNNVYNGVEVNSFGKPVAYHFYTTMSGNGLFSGQTVRVPAIRILHLFDENYEGQTRGFPLMACVVRSLKMAHAYDEAELVAARVDASRNGSYQQKEGIDPTEIAEAGDNGFSQVLEPGQDRIVPIGWEYNPEAPSRPNAGYGQFKKDVLRRIAAGLAVSYNTWSNDLEGVSYSSIRAGTLEDRETWKCYQSMVVNHILRPMYRRAGGWLDNCLTAGATPLPFSKRAKFGTCDTWLGKRWQWVDPMSEAQSNVIAVEHGWTTDSDIAAENGKDFYDNVETIKTEAEWTKGTSLDKALQQKPV